MIFENTGLVGLQSDLQYLDESAGKAGFIRWQWEYYRATYDCKIEDAASGGEYFLRINTRAARGKLEKPDAVLTIEAVYLGKATFPHGLEYESTIPQSVLDIAGERIIELKTLLEA
ncbi:YugN family protein [Paenibacillus zanthoxyli]|uniref:YugN family protein n=1 Tax=Paenibacillus zanthoxyli TaxID=369399 RepID=UPI00046FE84F|nr:YugN family protein [Paenibacillus zanthoxyli]